MEALWQCGLDVYLAAILRAVQFLLEARKRFDLSMYVAAVKRAVPLNCDNLWGGCAHLAIIKQDTLLLPEGWKRCDLDVNLGTV